jgi:hypothetical protein
MGGEGAIGIAGHHVDPIKADHRRSPTIASRGGGSQATEASCRNREAHKPAADDFADRGVGPPEAARAAVGGWVQQGAMAADRDPRQSYFLTRTHLSLRSHRLDNAEQTGVIAVLFSPVTVQAAAAVPQPHVFAAPAQLGANLSSLFYKRVGWVEKTGGNALECTYRVNWSALLESKSNSRVEREPIIEHLTTLDSSEEKGDVEPYRQQDIWDSQRRQAEGH